MEAEVALAAFDLADVRPVQGGALGQLLLGQAQLLAAGWPTPNLTTTEAGAVTEQLAQAGTHLVCLNTWHPGDGELPAWWNDEEGAWMRQLDALRDEDRRQRERTSEPTEPSKEVHHA